MNQNLLTIVNNNEEELLLTKESQYRELARLKTAEKQQEAYKKIRETYAEGKVTAKNIREVIKEFIGDSGQTRQKRTFKLPAAKVKITDKGIEFSKLDSETMKIITKMKEALAKGKNIKISY
jgi:tRNA(Ser,Leu) C12 N-acetylase TAN1